MRYIDADKLMDTIFPIGLIDDGKYTINAKAVKYAIDNTPTADVVPKSEVDKAEAEIERLQTILDSYALQYGTVMDKHIVIERARQEIAREIFEEIEEFILTCIENDEKVFNNGEDEYYDGRFMGFKIIEEHLVELKKKYTEDQNNEN